MSGAKTIIALGSGLDALGRRPGWGLEGDPQRGSNAAALFCRSGLPGISADLMLTKLWGFRPQSQALAAQAKEAARLSDRDGACGLEGATGRYASASLARSRFAEHLLSRVHDCVEAQVDGVPTAARRRTPPRSPGALQKCTGPAHCPEAPQ